MQEYRLTVDKFLDHAAKWFGGANVIEGDAGRRCANRGYAELRERSNRLSGGLLKLGAKPGDRVATLAWNTLPHLETYYAVMGAGMVCHTLNPRMAADHLAAIVSRADDRIVAVSADLLPLLAEVAERCSTIEHVILLDDFEGSQPDLPLGIQSWSHEALIEKQAGPAEWGRFDEDSPAGLCFTSGTTGPPKGVLYTHRSNYLHTLRALQADAMAFTATDTVMVAVPMFHANGWGIPFAAPAVGANMVLPGRQTDGASLARLLREEKVTVAVGIHTLWLGVAEHLESSGETLPDLQRIIIGGSSCPDNLIERMEKGLGARVQTSWGMTELSPLGTIMPVGTDGRAVGAGRPPMGLDLKLVDEAGETLPEQVGVLGHLRVKGASVVDRYFGDSGSALDREGYFDTGDLATLDVEGNLTIGGRSKDLIKSGGEWINPTEIEAIVGNEPGVSLVAVIGMPDEKWTERPLLVVQPQSGRELDVPRMLASLRDAVVRWWIPDRLARIANMPLTGSGKIDKNRLRADFAAGKIATEPFSP